MATERLVSCAIIRDGETHIGCRSHSELRAKLGDKNTYQFKPGDTEGFMTDAGRFVSRDEAQEIGMQSGQVVMASIRLLSSEVMWDRTRSEDKPKTSVSKPPHGKRWQKPKKRF